MISNTKSIFKSLSIIQWTYFSANIFSMNESAQLFYLCPTLVTLCILACQAPLSMEFSWQQYWSGLPFPPPTQGVNACLPSLHFRWILYAEPPGKPQAENERVKKGKKNKKQKTMRHHGSCQKSSIILVCSFLHFPTLPSGTFREPWGSPWK